MVSINPAGSEPIRENHLGNNTVGAKKITEDNIWEQYDNDPLGEKGVIDKYEVYRVVKDNMLIAGIKNTSDKINRATDFLNSFVGAKWNNDTYKEMKNKLQEFIKNEVEKFDGLAE